MTITSATSREKETDHMMALYKHFPRLERELPRVELADFRQIP